MLTNEKLVNEKMDTKNIWKSKTFWFGLLNIAAAIVLYFQGVVGGAELFSLNGLIIIILRALTQKGITLN